MVKKSKTKIPTCQPPGRPLKLDDPSIVSVLLECIRRGMTYKFSCQRAGVTTQTFNRWMEHGRLDELKDENSSTIFSRFRSQVHEAEVEGVENNLRHIENAAHDTWRAAAWILERRYREDYAKKQQVTPNGDKNAPIQVQGSVDKGQLEQTLDRLLAVRQARKRRMGEDPNDLSPGL